MGSFEFASITQDIGTDLSFGIEQNLNCCWESECVLVLLADILYGVYGLWTANVANLCVWECACPLDAYKYLFFDLL